MDEIKELEESRQSAIDGFKELVDAHIGDIMSARAMLLKVESMTKDGDELRKEMDEYIAIKGREYEAKYADMKLPEIMFDHLEARAERQAKVKSIMEKREE